MTVEWRPVPFYADLYEASSLGDIRNKKRKSLRKVQTDKDGYKCLILTKGGKQRKFRRSRLICMTFHGLPPTPMHEADHINEVKGDDRAVNVRWLTSSENQTHSNGITRYFKDLKGRVHKCESTRTFCKEHSLDRAALSRLMRGIYKTHKGWTLA